MIIFINDNMLKTADELLYIALYQVSKIWCVFYI